MVVVAAVLIYVTGAWCWSWRQWGGAAAGSNSLQSGLARRRAWRAAAHGARPRMRRMARGGGGGGHARRQLSLRCCLTAVIVRFDERVQRCDSRGCNSRDAQTAPAIVLFVAAVVCSAAHGGARVVSNSEWRDWRVRTRLTNLKRCADLG